MKKFKNVFWLAAIVASAVVVGCEKDEDDANGNSGFDGTIKATVNIGGVDVDKVKVHISPYDLGELGGGQSGGGSSDPVVTFLGDSVNDLNLRAGYHYQAAPENISFAIGTYVKGMYGYDELILNFLNPVPDECLSSLLPVTDAKVMGAFNSGGISGGTKVNANGEEVWRAGCFFYANVDVNANMNNLTVGDAFAGFVYADRDVSINVSLGSIETYHSDQYVDENGQPSNNGLHVRKERMQDSPFGSKIFLNKGWNKLYLIWQQFEFESEIEKSGVGVGAGWKITDKEPDGMKWYFSKGSVAIQGKLQGNSKMDDHIDIEKTTVKVTGISFNQGVLSLRVGQVGYLQANVTPSNATYPEVNWAIDNGSVATVTAGGRQDIPSTAVVFTGLVNATGVGTATITATTIDGRKVATATVNVYAP